MVEEKDQEDIKKEEMKEYLEKLKKLCVDPIKYMTGVPHTVKPYLINALAVEWGVTKASLYILEALAELKDDVDAIREKINPRGAGRPKRTGKIYEMIDALNEKVGD
jgi:hypothetical protein